MNKYLSVKFKVISFMLMILVVFIHSQNISDKLLSGNTVIEHGYSSFFQDFISDGMSLVAVPLFFLISGYLFFLRFSGSFQEFKTKYTKRAKTLIVPYLCWSSGVLLFIFALQLFPFSKSLFESKLIKDYSMAELLNRIFISPIPIQLWFVRDLIILTFLSPVLYWLIRKLNIVLIIVLLITWFINFDLIILSGISLLFFVLGSYLSIHNSIINLNFRKRDWIYTFLWFIVLFCTTIFQYLNFENLTLLNILHKTGILVGVVAVWSLFDILFKNKDLSNNRFYGVCSFSFFIYAFHVPSLMFIKKGIFIIFGKEEFSSLFNYITAPVITISLGIFIGYLMKRYIPTIYGIITGSR